MKNEYVAYVVTAPSGVQYRHCLLGVGATEKEAWLDAYGPECKGKKPKHARSASCMQVTEEELENLQEAAANH